MLLSSLWLKSIGQSPLLFQKVAETPRLTWTRIFKIAQNVSILKIGILNITTVRGYGVLTIISSKITVKYS